VSPSAAGPLFALAAFLAWGFGPVYFKAVARVPAWEVLAHRVVWTCVLLLPLAVALRRIRPALAALAGVRTRRALGASTALIALNWLLFVYAVQSGRVLDASLGYFINPLVNVALGRLFLGERLRGAQRAAVALATASVLLLALTAERTPWIAVALGVSFGLYGLLRKTTALDSMTGLLFETALLLPAALAALIGLATLGRGAFGASRAGDALLAASCLVTAVPLVCFAAAARRMSLTALGFFQYLAPTTHFLLAVWVYGEPFARPQILAFSGVWTALALVSADALLRRRPRAAGPGGDSGSGWTGR
jgi:chloramphenicol-sensitive protein RarD